MFAGTAVLAADVFVGLVLDPAPHGACGSPVSEVLEAVALGAGRTRVVIGCGCGAWGTITSPPGGLLSREG